MADNGVFCPGAAAARARRGHQLRRQDHTERQAVRRRRALQRAPRAATGYSAGRRHGAGVREAARGRRGQLVQQARGVGARGPAWGGPVRAQGEARVHGAPEGAARGGACGAARGVAAAAGADAGRGAAAVAVERALGRNRRWGPGHAAGPGGQGDAAVRQRGLPQVCGRRRPHAARAGPAGGAQDGPVVPVQPRADRQPASRGAGGRPARRGAGGARPEARARLPNPAARADSGALVQALRRRAERRGRAAGCAALIWAEGTPLLGVPAPAGGLGVRGADGHHPGGAEGGDFGAHPRRLPLDGGLAARLREGGPRPGGELPHPHHGRGRAPGALLSSPRVHRRP
mmetsp:Transcript_47821/g.133205  ORF Transcript_47821/g.133205 Transcript_47821/m.133205 type:complete len:345 (+) Transcript_47821:966-2000(+)